MPLFPGRSSCPAGDPFRAGQRSTRHRLSWSHMKIEAIELYRVAMPVIYPFRTAYGDGHVIESVLVRMSAQGLDGWGESTPWESPLYSPEWAVGVFALIRDWLAPRLLGQGDRLGRGFAAATGPLQGQPLRQGRPGSGLVGPGSQKAGQAAVATAGRGGRHHRGGGRLRGNGHHPRAAGHHWRRGRSRLSQGQAQVQARLGRGDGPQRA